MKKYWVQFRVFLNQFKLQHFAVFLVSTGVALAFWFLAFGGYLRGNPTEPDPAKAKEINPFITGLVAPLLTIGSTLLIYLNLRNTARQNFSSNFFKLMEMHHKLRDGISEEVYQISEGNASKGKDFFDDICERICFDYNNPPSESWSGSDKETRSPNSDCTFENLQGKERLVALYDHYFHVHQSSLGHYFRNLYYLVKYADESNFSKTFKYQHIRMLRAQLSNYELLLLAYNCLHIYGKDFYPLVERYEFLKSLNNEDRLSVGREKRIVDPHIVKDAYPHLALYWKTIN